MGNVAAQLGAGTTVGFDAAASGTFALVEGIQTLGAIGDTAESKDKTTLSDTRMTYGAGMTDSPDMEIGGIYLPQDTDQKAFVDACKAKTEMEIQVTWSNGTIGTFTFQPFGFAISESSAGEWIMFTINGKQNTDVVWTETTPP